jgi:hypothetical protein
MSEINGMGVLIEAAAMPNGKQLLRPSAGGR